MSERTQRRRSRQTQEAAPAELVQPARQAVDYDALLAEIDEVLQSDAEDYVRSFVQKGGQ